MKILDETGLKFIATKFKELRDSLNNKVDKVTGKDLSSNDYTNEAKAKVDAIPANPKYTDTVQDLSEYAKKNELDEKLNKSDKALISEEIDWKDDKSYTTPSFVAQAITEGISLFGEIIGNKANKSDLLKFKEQVILTQAEYDGLSSTDKNDASKIYFIKE